MTLFTVQRDRENSRIYLKKHAEGGTRHALARACETTLRAPHVSRARVRVVFAHGIIAANASGVGVVVVVVLVGREPVRGSLRQIACDRVPLLPAAGPIVRIGMKKPPFRSHVDGATRDCRVINDRDVRG